MMMQTPEPEFLLRRLVELAGDERDLLAKEEWEAALPVQEQFDELFAQLQVAAARTPLNRHHLAAVQQLSALHLENMALARKLQAVAGAELAKVGTADKLRGYAPLGSGHRPSPRYLDQSA